MATFHAVISFQLTQNVLRTADKKKKKALEFLCLFCWVLFGWLLVSVLVLCMCVCGFVVESCCGFF